MIYCIYHKDCVDGFAAWSVIKGRFPTATGVPAAYGEPCEVTPTVSDNVYIVDFSYPPEVLKTLGDTGAHVVVIDHHKTAVEALDGFSHPNVELVLDVKKCGARLTWEYLYPHDDLPALIEFVEDRDLWKKEIDEDGAIAAYLRSVPKTVPDYDEAANVLESYLGYEQAVTIGKGVLNYERGVIERAVVRVDIVEGIPTVNAAECQSDICHKLLAVFPTVPYVACWYEAKGIRRYSLRSRPDFDVSVVARAKGGGGHKNAAGYAVRV